MPPKHLIVGALFGIAMFVGQGQTYCAPTQELAAPPSNYDYASILKNNADAVLYVHSVRTKRDGTGLPENSFGTGFIFTEQGHALTAAHVILKEDADTTVVTTVSVRSPQTPPYRVEVIKRDDDIDLVLFVLPDVGIDWKYVSFGKSPSVPVGAQLFALGFPANLSMTPATGILSSRSGPHGLWQTTLGINHGHSGGPIFDMGGKVVAIADAGREDLQLVTFAIPESYAIGIRELAGNISYASLAEFLQPQFKRATVSQKFQFYEAAFSDDPKSSTSQFCLPPGTIVDSIKPAIVTKNGEGTQLIRVSADRAQPNCANLEARIEGMGVDQIGPIVTNDRGPGWLGINVAVTGKTIKTK